MFITSGVSRLSLDNLSAALYVAAYLTLSVKCWISIIAIVNNYKWKEWQSTKKISSCPDNSPLIRRSTKCQEPTFKAPVVNETKDWVSLKFYFHQYTFTTINWKSWKHASLADIISHHHFSKKNVIFFLSKNTLFI